jgi:hypothetical protein
MLEDWRHYQLTRDVEEKIIFLMDYFSLNYGAIDIILTPEGKHVFLELNPPANSFGSNARRVFPSPTPSQTFSSPRRGFICQHLRRRGVNL